MIYKSYRQMVNEVGQWAYQLRTQIPTLAGVVGIPRSGVLVASIIAMRLNIPLVPLEVLIAGKKAWEINSTRHKGWQGTILVVDDTRWSGNALQMVSEAIGETWGLWARDFIKYGVYLKGYNPYLTTSFPVDYWAVDTGGHPQLLEWTLLHVPFNQHTLVDLDGVLSEDWTQPSEEGKYASLYQEHLTQARPLIIPSYPVKGIVTSRLEKYRPETEAWLKKWGIEYGSLTMANYPDEQTRVAGNGFSGHKAKVYGKSDALLFVESDYQQAAPIHFASRKPVIWLGDQGAILYQREE